VAYNTLLYEKADGIGTVTINRPKALNAANSEVNTELYRVFEEIEADPEVRVVILTGSGDKAFMAGADIVEMSSLDAMGSAAFALTARKAVDRVYSLSKPVIAAISGFALGGGCELAIACDLRIASETARFGQPEITVGIIPGGGGTQRLPRLIGMARAKELVYTGDMINAQAALSYGLVNKVVPADKLMEEAVGMAKKLMSRSSRILTIAKSAINTGMNLDLTSGLDYEAQCFSLCFETEDQKEGMKAFVEKRKAEFKNK
jgi:enoyl-CoA hydratase